MGGHGHLTAPESPPASASSWRPDPEVGGIRHLLFTMRNLSFTKSKLLSGLCPWKSPGLCLPSEPPSPDLEPCGHTDHSGGWWVRPLLARGHCSFLSACQVCPQRSGGWGCVSGCLLPLPASDSRLSTPGAGEESPFLPFAISVALGRLFGFVTYRFSSSRGCCEHGADGPQVACAWRTPW